MKSILRIVASIFLLPAVLFGETVGKRMQMVPGQYVIGMKAAGGEIRTAALPVGKEIVKHLGRGSLVLVRDKGRGFRATAFGRFTDVSRQDLEFCKAGIREGRFESCSPNYKVTANVLPNDSRYSSLWGMTNIAAPDAWEVSTGNEQTVVAVVDTGIDYQHEDLSGNLWENPWEVPGNGIDDDQNGYVDDRYGINTITGSGNPFDDNGHGTHVAGTIGAMGDNGRGVAGVNWRTKIMGLKFLGASGSGSLADAIEAINYIVAMKGRGVNVRVVNNSWGGGGYSSALYNAIAQADSAGIAFVAAAGNDGEDGDAYPHYPSGYDLPNVIAVAAIDSQNNLASFSNYGATSVDIGAPGVGILSTVPNNAYASYSGTSMATPHVAGALALLLAREPSLTLGQLLQRLYDSGVSRSTLRDVTRTGRSLNVSNMLRNVSSPLPTPTATPAPCSYTLTEIGFAPNRAAEDAPILLDGDDSYVTRQLTRPILFGTSQQNNLTVSTNGPIYFNQTPSSPDWSIGSIPPKNSIAPLWLDRDGTIPLGLRMVETEEGLVLHWRSWIWNYPRSQEQEYHIQTWAELMSSGTVRIWLEFADTNIESYVQDRGVLGLRESTVASAITANSSAIRSRTGFEFVPLCVPSSDPTAAPTPSPTPTPGIAPTEVAPEPIPTPIPADPDPIQTPVPVPVVASLQAFNSNRILAGDSLSVARPLWLVLLGLGTGQIFLEFSLDDRACPDRASISMVNGQALWGRALPHNLAAARRISFGVGELRSSYRLARRRGSPSRLTNSLFLHLCRTLVRATPGQRLRRRARGR